MKEKNIYMSQVTLQSVRISKNYTVEEAAKHCQVSVEDMEKLESQPGEMPASMVMKLRKIYGFPIDYVSLLLIFGLHFVA